jgi:hypothetical protein
MNGIIIIFKEVGMKRLLVLLVAASALIGCSPTSPKDDRGITVSNDKRIEVRNDTVPIFVEEGKSWLSKRAAGMAQAPKKIDSLVAGDGLTYDMIRVAQIMAVKVNGVAVQANDIVIKGNRAVIAYNTAGDDYRGAIQVVDITSPDKPVILDELKFATMDINVVDIDGNTLLFGGQGDPDLWGFISSVGKAELSSLNIDDIISSIVGMASYNTTGICRHGNNYYVGVGAQNGKIMKLGLDYSRADSIDIADVRHIDAYENGVISVAGTTDNASKTGKIVITKDNDFHNPTIIALDNFESNYHKATIEVYEGKTALLGLSMCGFQVYDLKSTTRVFLIENPQGTATVPANCNSVSTDGKLIFTANGGYGFRVFCPKNSSFAGTELLGYYHPDVLTTSDESLNGYTANHIECKSNYVFVASGAAGVHVYSLKARK